MSFQHQCLISVLGVLSLLPAQLRCQEVSTNQIGPNSNPRITLTAGFGLGDSKALGEASELMLGLRPAQIPLWILFESESYRTSTLSDQPARPEDLYLNSIRLRWIPPLPFRNRVELFVGGGLGSVKVEKFLRRDDPLWDNDPFASYRGVIYAAETGLYIPLGWKLGLYGEVSYFYARKRESGARVIDIQDPSWMAGIAVRFGILR